jgi:hypothetical protein
MDWDSVYAAGRRLLVSQGAYGSVCRACQGQNPTATWNGKCRHVQDPRQQRQQQELKAIHARTRLEQQAKLHQGASELMTVRGHLDYIKRDRLAAELRA